MSDTFRIKLNCVVFSTNMTLNQRFVLSLNKDTIIFPSTILTADNLSNIDEILISLLKQHIFISDLELLPQLISIHNDLIPKDTEDNTINVVYGFIVKHTNSLNNADWIEFEILREQPYSKLLFEVIQKLR